MSTKLYLYKRSNGFYYIGYFYEGLKRWKSTGKQTKFEALKILQNFEQHLQKKQTSISFEQFIEQFKTLQAHSFRVGTLSLYEHAFNSFKAIIGNKLLSQYTLRDVETFKSKRLETYKSETKTITPTTVNIEFRTLRAAFNLAIKWQLLKENPFTKSSQVKAVEQLPTYLTREDFQKVLAATVEQVLKDIFLFAALSGLRLGEIINLQWQAVDLQRKLITVENSGTFQTKSGKVRVLPMGEDVYRMLLRRSTLSSGGYVFNKKGYQLLPDFVSKKFKSYVRACGLNEALHFHSLRHTNATWLVQSGVNIYQVQKLLGHSDTKTTQVYSHLAASELHEAVNKIGFN
jgi:integrase